jgi:prepilin-type N-terminal cleavage/methylation domain-containing protein
MKPICSLRSRRGFTLIELLVVISIIAILASMLLPALASAKAKAHVAKAKTEIANIATAASSYHADYSRYPSSPATRNAVDAERNPDFTFGTVYRGESGSQVPMVNKKGQTLPTVKNQYTKGGYDTSNAEVMAILMNLERFPDGQYTVNRATPQNPKNLSYLNAKMAVDNRSAGVGRDGVYRDPFGNPYIITFDLNEDNKCLDGFYRAAPVSQENQNRGFNGLVNGPQGFEARVPVMIWSFGQDSRVDANVRANLGPNKDNILSWK